MKILLLELSGSDFVSRFPSKYGGAGITFRRLAENIENCYLAALNKCFEGDITNKCIPLTEDDINYLRSPYLLDDEFSWIKGVDIVVYSNPGIVLATTKLQLCWAVGANETINPQIKHLLLHNPKWQQPIIQNPDTKIYKFVLGIETPLFQRHDKIIDIFQCSNHYSAINSHLVAHWCTKYEIRGIFAGPIDPNYKKIFLNEIDYKYAIYIGQIDEEEKIKLMKSARCYTNLVAHPINGPQLSVKQAWSYGCSIISTKMGIMPEVVENGVNGFIINNEEEFVNAVRTYSHDIDQKDCYETARNWSLGKMVDSFTAVCNEVINAK